MATIKDVAARAGVSLGTVSNVLAGQKTVTVDLRRRVEKAIRELNYKPNIVARSLKTRQTRTLGMVVSDITNPFFPQVVRGAEDAARKFGYVLMTFNTDDSVDHEKQIFEILTSRRVDGLLVIVALPRSPHDHLRSTIAHGIPVVCLDRKPDGVSVDSVTVDGRKAVREATEYLIGLGHSKIAYLSGPSNMYIASERLGGYLDAMKQAKLKPRSLEGIHHRDTGYKLGRKLLTAKVPPTALLCGNLFLSLGAIEAARELGISIPGQLSVATFDYNPMLDSFKPTLTSIVQPPYEMGFQGAKLLIDRIEGRASRTGPQHILLPTSLRIGQSTAAPTR